MPEDPYRSAGAIERDTEEKHVRGLLAPELVLAEELYWVGRPKQGICFSPLDILLIPFGLIWTGFVIVWLVAMISGGSLVWGLLGGLPFLAAGLFFMLGRILLDARQRSRTYYGVTDRRVLIVTASRRRGLTAVDLASSVEMSLEEKADRTGTISLNCPSYVQNLWHLPITQRLGPPTLWRVSDAREVFKIIQAAQQALHASALGNDG